MNNKKEKTLKKITNYNRELLEKGDDSVNEFINQLIILNYKGHSIWNPLLDETGRFRVDPKEKYGEKEIDSFISEYNKQIKEN